MKYVAENLFGIDGWNIAWYGVIIACGMILGVILASVRARQDGLKSDMLLDFMLFATPIAILCARVYYVIFEWESYADNLWSAFKIWEGGLAWIWLFPAWYLDRRLDAGETLSIRRHLEMWCLMLPCNFFRMLYILRNCRNGIKPRSFMKVHGIYVCS